MSAKSEFRRARRREREQAAALPPHPVREAEERVAKAADDRARYELGEDGRPDAKRPRANRDPIADWTARKALAPQLADAAHWYRWAWHASRSTVVAAPINQGSIKGAAVPPQEIAMESLQALRLAEAAVPAPLRARWLDPVVVDYRTAASVAEQRSREDGRSITAETATSHVREALALLVPARAEWERLEATERRGRRGA